MVVPGYLDHSFEYDETVIADGIHDRRRSNTPRYFWRELLNPTMAVFKLDYITRLCLYSVGAEAHYKRAFLLDILGYNDLAAIEYTRAIELNPHDDRYYNNRGNLYTQRGYLFLAVRDFNKAIEINPNKAQAYYNRGRALEKMGSYDAAKLDYEKAVELGICKIYPSLKVCK
jgi:tetratricopeptide (TPR) repeat protein